MGKLIQSQVFIFTYILKFAFSQDSTGTHHVTDSAVAMEMTSWQCQQRSRDISDELTWPTRPNMSQWFVDRRNQCRAMVFDLFDRGVILGRDDSVLHDGDTVYMVNYRHYGLSQPMCVVDEFLGLGCYGYPTAHLSEPDIVDDESCFDAPSFAMVSQAGCFVNAVICIQRLFRTRRSFRTLVGAQLLPIRLRHMVIQHTVAQFLDLRPPAVPVFVCSCGFCDLAWFKEGWICPWFWDIAGVSQAASLG